MKWYKKHQRNLPWRQTKDPYCIWVSEIILQQTRVDQGLSYYNAFIKVFPDVFKLAAASEQGVLKQWQGLGYYSRARNMHHSANQIVKLYNGRFPDKPEDIIRLKGIGEYTAAAILSIAFNKSIPVIDGNVVRVLSRIWGITKAYDTADGKNTIRDLAHRLIGKNDPGTYNQAVMEFGALCCTPQNPQCSSCIFNKKCKALATGNPENFPVKKTKQQVAERHYLYFVILAGSGRQRTLCLRERTGTGIWKSLYDFPCLESDAPADISSLSSTDSWKQLFGGSKVETGTISREYIHKLSHIRMHVRFLPVSVSRQVQGKNLYWVKPGAAGHYPVPRLIEKYLDDYLQIATRL